VSYVRFSDESEVYLIGTKAEGDAHVIECCGCRLTADVRKARTDEERAQVADISISLTEADPADLEWDWGPVQHFTAGPDALAHLQAHREAGHRVPDSAFDRIRTDDWLAGAR
jgi:hypothetical protein